MKPVEEVVIYMKGRDSDKVLPVVDYANPTVESASNVMDSNYNISTLTYTEIEIPPTGPIGNDD